MNSRGRQVSAENVDSCCDEDNQHDIVDRRNNYSAALSFLGSAMSTAGTLCHGNAANWLLREHQLSLDIVPSNFDVLLGRGRKFRDHPANKRLRKLVHQLWPKYEDGCREEKTDLSKQIVQMVKTGGTVPARFLKFNKTSGSWVEIDDELARLKVSHVFRDFKRRRQSSGEDIDSKFHVTATLIENESSKECNYINEQNVPLLPIQSDMPISSFHFAQNKAVTGGVVQQKNLGQNACGTFSGEEVAPSFWEGLNHVSFDENVSRIASFSRSLSHQSESTGLLQILFGGRRAEMPAPIYAQDVLNGLLWRQLAQTSAIN